MPDLSCGDGGLPTKHTGGDEVSGASISYPPCSLTPAIPRCILVINIGWLWPAPTAKATTRRSRRRDAGSDGKPGASAPECELPAAVPAEGRLAARGIPAPRGMCPLARTRGDPALTWAESRIRVVPRALLVLGEESFLLFGRRGDVSTGRIVWRDGGRGMPRPYDRLAYAGVSPTM
jgi:hypothetical protein